MTLPANLNVYISAAVFVIGAYVFALYAGLIVWTVRDVRRRSRDVMAQIMAVLLVGIFTVPGLLVYLLLRPQTTLAEEYERSLAEESLLQDLDEKRVCPGCQRRVEAEFIVCPVCHHQLRLRCVGCGRLLDPVWDVCPYCGLYRELEEEKPVRGRRKARRRREARPEAHAQPIPVTEPAAVARPAAAQQGVEPPEPMVAFEEPLPADLTDEPAGELPRIDADEVTFGLEEVARQGVTLSNPDQASDTGARADELSS